MAYDGGSGPSKPPPPPRYVMLTEEYGSNSLATYRKDDDNGGGLCGCLCWCCCFLLLVASVAATAAYLNPNDMVGIGYGARSRTVVSYRGTMLCSGRLPAFYQGQRNTTVMTVAMEGWHGFGSGLQSALEESEKAGNVPLNVYVSVLVTLRLGDVDLREVTINVHLHARRRQPLAQEEARRHVHGIQGQRRVLIDQDFYVLR
uniref:Late embryogenesis abundant protein LEA-2 subgroup domain-containing protein n=1 Tax=Oryza punctata TaxID=4537 RepID=A0A0E0LTS2_ORYPU